MHQLQAFFLLQEFCKPKSRDQAEGRELSQLTFT